MERPSDNRPADEDVIAFLRGHHGSEPTGLEPLHGGYWSAAYGYRIGDDELVLRINDSPDGFRSDELAMAYGHAQLPVPEVLEIGEAFGRWFAISRRHHGRFLEAVEPEHADALGPAVVDLLTALREVPDTGIAVRPWREWLLAGLTDVPGQHTSGWRAKVAADPVTERTFAAADARVRTLLDACPDRRQLVHSDLLHFNVLVTPDADAVTAVFSWKCSTWGDSLYDLAWCTFWAPWHPGIAALELWDRLLPTLPTCELEDASVRHHAYELQIGASHLGWFATLDDREHIARTCRALDEIMERGPR